MLWIACVALGLLGVGMVWTGNRRALAQVAGERADGATTIVKPTPMIAETMTESTGIDSAGDVAEVEAIEDEAKVEAQVEPKVVRFNGRAVKPGRTLHMTVTAYCPCSICCGKGARGITASGMSVQTNGGALVAADARVLPFWSLVSIPGYDAARPVPVLDRGGKIKGQRLDVLMPTHAQARAWGVREVDVTVWNYVE